MKNHTPEDKPTPDEILTKRYFYGYAQGQACKANPEDYLYFDHSYNLTYYEQYDRESRWYK